MLSQIIRTHFKSLLWIAAIQLAIEIGNYFLMDSAGLITNTVAEYIIFFILVPTIINALTVCASVGLVAYPKCGSTVDEVYRMADTALYEAKNAGKGQYKVVALV